MTIPSERPLRRVGPSRVSRRRCDRDGDDHGELERALKLANVCKAVSRRVSPAQKRLIVGLVRRKDTTRPVL